MSFVAGLSWSTTQGVITSGPCLPRGINSTWDSNHCWVSESPRPWSPYLGRYQSPERVSPQGTQQAKT